MPTVLIVDDDPHFAAAVAEVVDLFGHTPLIARDGLAALRFLESERVDLLIADVRMPRLDGQELLRALRERGDRTPAIVTSGVATGMADLEDAVFLRKPFEL